MRNCGYEDLDLVLISSEASGSEAELVESLAWQGKTPVKNSKFKIEESYIRGLLPRLKLKLRVD